MDNLRTRNSDLAEGLAEVQEFLFTLEATALGFRKRMEENGWSSEVAQGIAAMWMARMIDFTLERLTS